MDAEIVTQTVQAAFRSQATSHPVTLNAQHLLYAISNYTTCMKYLQDGFYTI